MKRVGILTSGGDCQGLNSAIRGVAKGLYEEFGKNVEIYGIKDGYKGLIFGEYKLMQPSDFSGILTLGGTLLGTSRQPFKTIRVIDENSVDKVAAMKSHYKKMKLDCLVILGGNGIHTTATSHGRIFIVEVMGHKVGWLTLSAGIAGGADVILLPEIPYDIDKVAKTLQSRIDNGKKFSILAVAEGALSKEEAKLSKKEFKKKRAEEKYPSIVYRIADELQDKIDNEIRVCVPGHFQRGGSPCAYDRVLCTRLGATAARFIKEKTFGVMVGMVNGETVPVPLEDVAGKLKSVPVDCGEIKAARQIGVSFGD